LRNNRVRVRKFLRVGFQAMSRVVKRSASQAPVKSGRSRRDLPLPQFVRPQLSRPVEKPPSGPQWGGVRTYRVRPRRAEVTPEAEIAANPFQAEVRFT
jgi:hypothetical protein